MGDGFYIHDYADLTSTAASQPWWALTFDLVVKLGLVVGLIYVTMWLLRAYVGRGRAGAVGAGAKIDVLEATALAPGRSLYLIDVADRVLVVGATSGSLATLAEITEPGTVERLRRRSNEPRPGEDGPAGFRPTFAEQLRAITEHLPATFMQDKVGELRLLAERFRGRALPPHEEDRPTDEAAS
jgi:flagellar biosynthetic protein FliO